jgi:hypothetical protein
LGLHCEERWVRILYVILCPLKYSCRWLLRRTGLETYLCFAVNLLLQVTIDATRFACRAHCAVVRIARYGPDDQDEDCGGWNIKTKSAAGYRRECINLKARVSPSTVEALLLHTNLPVAVAILLMRGVIDYKGFQETLARSSKSHPL